MSDYGATSDWYWFRLGSSDWYYCIYSGQRTNVACTNAYGSEYYCDGTIPYPWTPSNVRFVMCQGYTTTGCPVIRVKQPAYSTNTMSIRFTNQVSITWTSIGICALALLKK